MKCASSVREILVRSGRVSGVALDSGEKIEADNVVSTIDVKRVAGLLPQELLTAPVAKSVGGNPFGLVQRRRNQSRRGIGSTTRVSRRDSGVCGITQILNAHAGRLRVGDENCDRRPDSRAAAAHGGDSFRGRSLAMSAGEGDAVGFGICARGFHGRRHVAGRERKGCRRGI